MSDRFFATQPVYTFTSTQNSSSESSSSSSPRQSAADEAASREEYLYDSEAANSSSRLLLRSGDETGGLSARPSRCPSPADFSSALSSPRLTRSVSSTGSWPSTKEVADDSYDDDEDGDDEESSGSIDSAQSHYAGLVAKLGFKSRTRPKDAPNVRGKRRRRKDTDAPPPPRAWLSILSQQRSRSHGVIALDPVDDDGARWFRRCWRACLTFLRHPCFPATPVTLLFALVLVASFAFSLTTFIIHVLDTDKEPLPWRTFCQDQRPFPHELADGLAPVDVFVGVFSVDAAYERRHLIRTTYARHTKPIDPLTGQQANNVQLKFIVGRPRTRHARRVALEMELYGDLVVLDVKENMNSGKTYAFFKWAAENATVPIYYRRRSIPPEVDTNGPVAVAFKRADYIVKADDDSFLMLDEIERHLRIAPRQKTYWGYLIRQLFMGGEVYAVSADLTDYIASYTPLEGHTHGAEDKKVARWMRMHPNASSINWVTERCWIYDHPKAGTTYSHGFLFPDEVERIRAEGRRGLAASERERRGGALWAQSWSSVTTWRQDYTPPAELMSIEEESEALIEGGGRWRADQGWRAGTDYVAADLVHLDFNEPRVIAAFNLSGTRSPTVKETWLQDAQQSNVRLRYNKFANDLLRNPDDVIINLTAPASAEADSATASPDPPFRQTFAQIATTPMPPRLVPLPTLRYDGRQATLQARRMLGLAHGGTVAVHFLKRNEWFLETAVVLLGREHMWDAGSEPAAATLARISTASDVRVPQAEPIWDGQGAIESVETHWGSARMYGSPILVPNGGNDVYISEGRPLPALEPSPPLTPVVPPPPVSPARFGHAYADPETLSLPDARPSSSVPGEGSTALSPAGNDVESAVPGDEP